MSFPVPTKYNLTDDKNQTVVVYNDGREEELLPWVDGAGGGESGGLIVIASGSFTGNSESGRQTLSIGPKMASKDFYVLINVQNGSVITRNGYTYIYFLAMCFSKFGYYDLSGIGTNPFISDFSIVDNNDGTTSNKVAGKLILYGEIIVGGSINNNVPNTFKVIRRSDDTGFELYFGNSNPSYNFPSDVHYTYEVVYFGTDPENDIITI